MSGARVHCRQRVCARGGACVCRPQQRAQRRESAHRDAVLVVRMIVRLVILPVASVPAREPAHVGDVEIVAE